MRIRTGALDTARGSLQWLHGCRAFVEDPGVRRHDDGRASRAALLATPLVVASVSQKTVTPETVEMRRAKFVRRQVTGTHRSRGVFAA